MVLFDLLISCESENVSLLSYGGANYEWHLTLKCQKCGIVNESEVYFSGNEKIDVPDSRGSCNFIMKCKNCKCVMNLTYDLDSPQQVQVSEKTGHKVLARFECRGGEPISWNAKGLNVHASSGTVFEDCDLTDTWTDYDESESVNCVIDSFKYEFQRSKNK